jgi:hypothetical protein
MTSTQDRRYTLRSRVMIGTGAAVLLFISIAIGGGIGTKSAEGNNDRKEQTIERVRKSPDLPLSIDNTEEPPILIQAASMKEVSGAKYQELTGIKTDSLKCVTFPNVRLINNTNQTVTAFILILVDKHSTRNKALMMSSLNLEPFKDFSIEPVIWAKPRRQMMSKFAEKEGTFQEDKSLPDLNSEEMWLPGGVSEFSVLVAKVEFADGSEWLTKR